MTEIVERDIRKTEKLIRTAKELQKDFDLILDVRRLSNEWDLLDSNVFTVRNLIDSLNQVLYNTTIFNININELM